MNRTFPKRTLVGLGLCFMVLGLVGCGGGEPPQIPDQTDAAVFVKIVGITDKEKPRSFQTEGHVAPGNDYNDSMEWEAGTVHLIAIDRADYGEGQVFEKGDIVVIDAQGKPILAPVDEEFQIPITMTEFSSRCPEGYFRVPAGSKFTNLRDESDFGYTVEMLHGLKGQWREIDSEGNPLPENRERLFISFDPIDLDSCIMAWIGGGRVAGRIQYRVLATNVDRNQILLKINDSDPVIRILCTVIEPRKKIALKWSGNSRYYEFLPIEGSEEEEVPAEGEVDPVFADNEAAVPDEGAAPE